MSKNSDRTESQEDLDHATAESTAATAATLKHLRSMHSSGMESSVLRFKDLSFVVGKKDKENYILRDVTGTVKWGHVLAIMGPSGAGKTTLINSLTLDAFHGKATGNVTLNGVALTDRIFKHHCYVVVQKDKHWPFLTCRETLRYCAQLYDVAAKDDIDAMVDEIISKMGLTSCADTRNASLSGGQARRLSLGVALLKQPTLLFLDEPTSGLDSAAADNIMQEIVRVAKDERLIIVCTIHQPSSKVYSGFDQVMILSKGREAFSGDVKAATPYFESIGYPLPVQTNPAEHFLDLVNADFSDDKQVDNILDTWQEKRPEGGSSSHHKKGFAETENDTSGVVDIKRASLFNEMRYMFDRHFKIITRDPLLYAGRAVFCLLSNIIFALVYLRARSWNQDQAINKLWVSLWFIGVPTNIAPVAVYALNDEFKSIAREMKNGLVRPVSYVLAKSVLTLPIMFIFAIFSLGIPAFAIIKMPASSFGLAIVLWTACFYVFECAAEFFSVWTEDPILGMMNLANFWFGSFLFGGFLISLDQLVWPFKLFYYIMPFSYFVRSFMYVFFSDTTWEPCDPAENPTAAICVDPPTGENVLQQMSLIYGVLSPEKQVAKDIGVLIGIAAFYKLMYVLGIVLKSHKASKFQKNPTTV